MPRRLLVWLAAVGALVAAVALTMALGEPDVPGGPTDSLPAGADSTQAVALQQQLPEEDAATAVAVFSTVAVARLAPASRSEVSNNSRTSISSAVSTGSERFHDASEQGESPSSPSRHATELPGAARHQAWVVDFESWKPDSPDYTGLDAQLQTRLTARCCCSHSYS